MSGSSAPSHGDYAPVVQSLQKDFDAKLNETTNNEDKLELLDIIEVYRSHIITDALQRPPAESEQVLAILWHMFLDFAKILDKDDPFQQKLLLLLLLTKEYHTLRRSLHPVDNASTACDSYYFTDIVQTSFEQLLLGTVSEQCNLAAFTATTLAVGICDDSLAVTALWFLRQALEETHNAATVPLLPAAVIWIEICGLKLLTLSIIKQSYEKHPKAHLLVPGPLAERAGIDEQGFSLKRWLFWRRRFQDLSIGVDLAEEAKRGFFRMIVCGRELDYDVPGEAKFKAAMEKELIDSGKPSVGGEDMDLSTDWET